MERPTKRRRLSDPDDSGDSNASSRATSPVERLPPPTSNGTTEPISRIKTKQQRQPPAQPVTEAPTSILESTPTTPITFAALGVEPWLTTSLHHLSIKHPTRIQTSCIPQILAGRDCIGGSRTGSGKTVAFAIPILQQWAQDPSAVFAVILTPTRELALQIHEQMVALGSRRGLRCALIVGGADSRAQAIELERRPHIVVATPGRLADHILNSGEETIRGLRRVKSVVLDEADRLLASSEKGSMLPDLETCLSVFPPPTTRQTCLFTATITPEVRALENLPRSADQSPVFVSEVDTAALAVPATLAQTYQLVNVVHKEKYLHILLLTPSNANKNVIIFCNQTSTCTLLEYTLRLLDHRVTSLHSGLSHTDRTNNLARFRARAARILIATDVASRGLDIPSVGLVVNYDLPRDPDTYIHRVGRTARAGRRGTSICLVGQRDVALVQAIEGRVGQEMQQYAEEGVSVEGRVVRDALNVVGEMKQRALLNIEEGRDVKGKKVRGLMNPKGLKKSQKQRTSE
ncbi:putative RNA helicase [Saxophila tyrrhenica]|uniref:RNA helicase n=1 Tax=Saxophila tyrrhenica TaxID=1690608 RepID=A0AAV9PJW1_9PEZI|nr:putative RNA helicase [Saxophila tyrrhenica]